MVRRLAPLGLLLLAGCSGESGEVSKKQDQELRNNFSRSLTPEEVAMMGKNKGVQPPPGQ